MGDLTEKIDFGCVLALYIFHLGKSPTPFALIMTDICNIMVDTLF